MGHYASEMAGPNNGPTNGDLLEEKLAKLQHDWDWAKDLFSSGHQAWQDGGKYTCPSCFALVNWWFLPKHDEWHISLERQMRDIARWTSPGRIG